MTPLVPVESGTAVSVCSYSPPSGTSRCGGPAVIVIRLRDPRMNLTTDSFRCAAHSPGRDIDILLSSFPLATLEIRRLPATGPAARSCAHNTEDAPYGVLGCCAETAATL